MLVISSHLIITAYGFWLPNDPRGSWSDFVGAWELLRFGRATKVTTHRSLAKRPHDRALRLEAKKALKHPPVRFTPVQIESIAKGFARAYGRRDTSSTRARSCATTRTLSSDGTSELWRRSRRI